ncbi:hypothetical protein HYC85_029904 [Camellia sinensis]|uniref:Uncharacterized protein n=1 Tax=Camellia sinensis TaxID=4442 RepID=A0A7J7FZ69_CAMSI|nr:hypothetical protein HYC85_029904 [Camellia sinensis]
MCRAKIQFLWQRERQILQNTLFRGLELKKRGKERRKLVWEKFGMNPGRSESSSPR